MGIASDVTAKLREAALPLELVKGEGGYCYFVWDQVDQGGAYETLSVMTPYLKDHTVEEWVTMGKAFAADMAIKHAEYLASGPDKFKLVFKGRDARD